ncbi:YtxH domain-containing protein [Patescibacteria group bacterium]|nr:YtxH domain-containing protein [Patescibacteria group bacterium]
MTNKKGKFFLAGLFGALAGAVGGLLLAPQSGAETREDIVKLTNEIAGKVKSRVDETTERVKDVFGKYTEEGKEKYLEIKDKVVSKVATVKTAGENIDKNKYGQVIEDVVAEFKDDLSATKDGAGKISKYLKKDWEKFKKALA